MEILNYINVLGNRKSYILEGYDINCWCLPTENYDIFEEFHISKKIKIIFLSNKISHIYEIFNYNNSFVYYCFIHSNKTEIWKFQPNRNGYRYQETALKLPPPPQKKILKNICLRHFITF